MPEHKKIGFDYWYVKNAEGLHKAHEKWAEDMGFGIHHLGFVNESILDSEFPFCVTFSDTGDSRYQLTFASKTSCDDLREKLFESLSELAVIYSEGM